MKTINYKGAEIYPSEYRLYEWHHPDHVDASYDDGGWSTYGCGIGKSIEECKEQIDDMLDEMPSYCSHCGRELDPDDKPSHYCSRDCERADQ